MLALSPVLSRLEGEASVELQVSTMTTTGGDTLRQAFPSMGHRYVPVDLPWPVGRALRGVDPALLVLTESELWPTLVTSAARRVPVVVVNGRVSDATFQRGRAFPLRGYHRWLLRHLTFVGARSQEDARRFVALGLSPQRVAVLGNMKFDRDLPVPNPRSRAMLRRELEVAPDAWLLVGGSTFPGEEEALLIVYRELVATYPRLRLLLAPRHVERIPDVERAARSLRVPTVRKSRLAHADEPESAFHHATTSPPPVILLDTVGELATLYAQAAAAFIGRSLAVGGGQNPLEALAQGVPVIFGPRMENFRAEAAEALARGAAKEVTSAAHLRQTMETLLDQPDEAVAMGQAGQSWIQQSRGAADRYTELLLRLSSRPGRPEDAGPGDTPEARTDR